MLEMARVSPSPMWVQLRPASVERYTPSPCEVVTPRTACSPMPTHTTFGSDSATATAPTDPVAKWPSLTLSHVMPASVVFHTPPPVAPK